ncbi:DUF917 domain-containing protein [Streptomyces sp. VRA16 Mangrove soil]|uniref:DUF917 domain-containing protein n=1 Tax=Streptomyces sp. VRA16 Mangrove soil TaxID=2817434 RepID=UPI001AA007BC|nr:DUF917 domain-containing protein [Streptomyces sp. VRA16 Mangrove soil]MBO1330204.1 DUF917 domain-containing protein [Streptomyces sp. VRA16 Mangrove soil]
MREITLDKLDDIARGAGILGTGGGGDPYIGKLLAREAIRRHGPVRIVDIDEVPAAATVVPISGMGAPTVLLERVPNGGEELAALRALEKHIGRPATHIAPIEIGGVNSMLPIACAAQAGLPIVDGDAMGRAFPEAQMVLPGLIGVSNSPMALADDKGNTIIVDAVDNHAAETIARAVCVERGCQIACADTVLRGDQLADGLVPATLTLAEKLGAAVRAARAEHSDPVGAARKMLDGIALLTGKVVDVSRRTEGGFARGRAVIEGITDDTGHTLELDFQNEHLLATRDGSTVATTPDLICVLDSETGEPVTTEGLRYGLRVSVVAARCDPRWTSPGGLALAGPRSFGYEVDYLPFGG